MECCLISRPPCMPLMVDSSNPVACWALLGKLHGQRSPVDCSPRVRRESHTAEHLSSSSLFSHCCLHIFITGQSKSSSVVFDSLQPHGLYSPWNSPGQNAGVGSCSLLQRIFPTQESNRSLLHCRRILYQLSYQGGPLVVLGPQSGQ